MLAWLREIQRRPRHPARQALDDLLSRLADDLQRDPEVMARAEQLKERLLTHPQVPETALAAVDSRSQPRCSTAMEDETS